MQISEWNSLVPTKSEKSVGSSLYPLNDSQNRQQAKRTNANIRGGSGGPGSRGGIGSRGGRGGNGSRGGRGGKVKRGGKGNKKRSLEKNNYI
jgi:hypothetical protein